MTILASEDLTMLAWVLVTEYLHVTDGPTDRENISTRVQALNSKLC